MKKTVVLVMVFALIFTILPMGVMAESEYVPKTIQLIANPDGTCSLPANTEVYIGDTLVFPRDEMVYIGNFQVRGTNPVVIRENAVAVANDIMVNVNGVRIGQIWTNNMTLNNTFIKDGNVGWFESSASVEVAGKFEFFVYSGHDAGWTEQYLISPEVKAIEINVLDPKTDYHPEKKVDLAVESKTAKLGDVFTVDVTIDNNNGISGLTVDVGYDEAVLEFVSGTAGDVFSNATVNSVSTNSVEINWEGKNNTENGTVATLTFRMSGDETVRSTAIAINDAEVYDADSENVNYEAKDSTVKIIACVAGDANSDGIVNNKDLGVLRRFLNDWDVEINMHASDVNCDGDVNNKDLGVLRRYLNDWDVELKCCEPSEDYVVVQKTAAEKATIKRAKILMMGDSTTAGDGSEAAFRFSMYQKLYEEGCYFQLVGDQASADYRLTNAYNRHLAQGGRTTDQLKDTYANNVAGGKIDYDIAVITIGVNDLYGGVTASTLRTKYRSLLDTVFNDRPDAKVYFAELIWMPDLSSTNQSATDKVIAELVDEYKGKGYDITLLKHKENSGYVNTNKDHIITFGPSGNHPNHIGNAEIGLGYAAALKDAILEINKQPAPAGQAKVVDPTGVTLSKTDVTLKIDEQIKLQYTVSPSTSDVKSVVLSSSDPTVATVDFQGIITAHKAGTATITARVVGTNIKATCKVTVTAEKANITAAGKTTLLTDNFSSTRNWATGGTFIKNGEMRVGWSSGLNAQTSNSFTISKDAGSIGFRCVIQNQMGTTNSQYRLSVTFGSYELQLCNNQATVKLLYNNQVIGTYTNSPQFYPADNYLVNFVDGKVTVYRNNETLITANAPADATGPVKVAFPMYGTMAIDDLTIKSGK